MGRQKIVIKKQELDSQRKSSFKKRSVCAKKKAMELSVLSDAKVMLLMLSPKGEYDLFLGENSTFDDIVQQFLSEIQETRNKSWKDSMKVLEKAFRGDLQSSKILMDHRMGHTEMECPQESELASIKEDISKVESQLGPLRNINEIDKIDSIDELTAAKKLIMELLVKNEREKEQFVEQQRFRFQNMTISNTRDLKCSTSTEIPAPTDDYVPALTDPNLPALTHPYVPAPNNPYVPAQTDPYSPALTYPYVPAPTYPYVPAPTVPYVPAPTYPYVPAPTVPYVAAPTYPYVPAPTDPCIPAPTDSYMHAINQQGTLMSNSPTLYQGVNSRYSANTGIAETTYSGMQQIVSMPDPTTSSHQRVSGGSTSMAVPTPTHPSMDGMDRQAELVPISNSMINSGEAMCLTNNAGSWSNILDQRVNQEQALMPNFCQSSETYYQGQLWG